MVDPTQQDLRLIVLIPTRNRASLAISAARSVLAESNSAVTLVLSDNSTDPRDVEALQRFCADHHGSLHYIRPPSPLAMARHWDWAMEHAVQMPGATHVCYLTDRMIVLPGELRPLLAVVAAHPDRVVVYGDNRVEDHAVPARLFLLRWTGGSWEIDSRHLLDQASRMRFHPLPRMLNCVVPIETVERIRSRFGSTFASIAPDFCFTFRCLASVKSIVYFDRSPILHYASDRSHGATLSRGEMSRDAIDFAAQLEVPRNSCTPLPALVTIYNAIVNEYLFVAGEVESRRLDSPPFPPLDRDRYLQEMAREVDAIANVESRRAMQEILAAQGPSRRSIHAVRLAQHLLRLPSRLLPSAVWRWVFRRWGVYPPGDAPLSFSTASEAMDQARRRGRRRHRLSWHVKALAPGARPLPCARPPDPAS